MIAPDVLQNLQEAYRRFYRTIHSIEPLYKPSQENFDVLVRWLRGQNIPEAEWCSEHIWSAAFVACKAAGSLEFEPSDQEKQMERAALLSARDAEESRANRREEDPPGKALARILREKADATRAEIQAEKERIAALQAKRDAENDLSIVPTVQQIRESGPLSAKEQHKLSAVQLRHYLHNLRRIEAEDAARRQAGTG